jgi:ABC-2 type transport system permease protein
MNTLRCSWLLAKKDLRCYFRDRGALVVGFLVPIALVTVFGWVMTSMSGGPGAMPKPILYVVDEASSESSHAFVDRLKKSTALRVLPKPDAPPLTRQDAEKKVADGDASHAIVIPSGFDLQDRTGSSPSLILYRDPGMAMEQQLIQIGLFQAAIAQSDGTLWWQGLKKNFLNAGLSEEDVAQVQISVDAMNVQIKESFAKRDNENESDASTKSETNGEPSDVSDAMGGMMGFMTNMVPLEEKTIEPPYRPQRVTYQAAQSVAGMTVMSLLFALTGCASILLAEREKGTLRRLFAMSIPRQSVLLGKLLFAAIIGIIQVSILFVYGELMFRVGLFRDPLTLCVLALTWVAAATSFGMLIASTARSSAQADGLAQVVILVMAALGGCWFPLQIMQLPAVLDIASKSMMTYWAMSGFQGMLWNQLDLSSSKIQIALGWQWVWAIALMALAMVMFRRNYTQD